MEYVRFGSTGMKVSKLCFGTMMFAMTEGWRNYALGKKDAKPVFDINSKTILLSWT